MTAALVDRHHNNPPSDAAILRDQLGATHADLATRTDELIAGVSRMPPAIEDETTEKRAIEFAKQIGAHEKLCDGTRKAVKAPYAEAVKVVDAFFGGMVDPLKTGRDVVLRKLTAFQTAKTEAERKAREEAARKAEEEARAAAAAITTDADLETAIAKEEQAVAAVQATEATTADLSRTRGTFGSTASLRTTWEFDIEDVNRVPAEFLMPNEAAIRAAIKGGRRDIPGVRIYQKQQTVVR